MSFKLYFRYGTMNSSKTANLLMVAHNYRVQNKKVLLIKPSIDDRFGKDIIKSRTGLQADVDILLNNDYNLLMNKIDYSNFNVILVDEAQFLTEKHVEQLRELTMYVPVICYGLRTDYKTRLFPGSKRLMELADTIEEIKTICVFCNKKSVVNMKHSNGKIIKEGKSDIELGTEEKYLSSCWKCWFEKETITS